MTDNRTTERVDHLPRVREAIDELMRKKDVTDNRTTELKPCPFCGGEAVLHPTYDMDTGAVDGWFAWCDNDTCECKPETGQFFTEAEAIEAWNSRAERTSECVAEYAKSPLDGKTIVLHRCSACNKLMRPHMNYCPNCGKAVK